MTEENTTQANNQEQAQDRGERFVWKGDDVQITLPQDQEPEVEMEQAEDETQAEAPRAIHYATRRGADMSLAKKEISQASHAAVLAGRITLQEARELGRNAGPDGPVDKVTTKATTPKKDKLVTFCIACGKPTKGGRFHPGADMKMYRIAREALDGERELTPEQREYLEESGKMAQVIAKREKDEAKRQERIATKAEKQRQKEGEAEKAKQK